MRITNSMIARSQLETLARNMAGLDKAQAQVSTGKRLQQASDDPTAATQIIDSGSALRGLAQYKTNVQRASSRVELEDSVLAQLGDLVTRAKEVGLQASGATSTAQTRAAAAAEMKELFGQVITLGNTRFGNEYLFGGDASQTAPFAVTGSGITLDYTATAASGGRSVAVGDGQTVEVAHDGSELLVSTGVLDAMKQLARALDPASTSGQPGVSTSLSSLDSAFDALQTIVGEVGARSRQLEMAQQNIDAYKTNLETFKSNLEDVDIETAITELTSRQMAYQAAMLSTTKVMSLTLTDYLR